MKILVKLNKDEFDCEMFRIFEADSIESLKESLTKKAKKLENKEIYFGANEFIQYSSDDFSRLAKYIELNDTQVEVLTTLFPGGNFGTGSRYLDFEDDDEDEEDYFR
jgi:hypothetical protein